MLLTNIYTHEVCAPFLLPSKQPYHLHSIHSEFCAFDRLECDEMKAKRDELRNYLETSGASLALRNAVTTLFQMPAKPENPIQFICRNMGGNDLARENEELKRQLA